MSLNRAYSIFEIKSVDAERRTFSGIATTPTPDRMDDIVDPMGVRFANPLPLHLYHDSRLPVGEVRFGKATANGIPFDASIPAVSESGRLKERVDEAWQSVKYRLIKGVSIGFRTLAGGIEQIKGGGFKFTKTEVVELSLVSIPANAEATIHSIKSYDLEQQAQPGTAARVHSKSASAVASGVPHTKESRMATPISDQLTTVQADLKTKSARLEELNGLDGADGGLEDAQAQEATQLTIDVKSLSGKVERLKALEQAQGAMAKSVIVRQPQGDVRDTNTPHVIVGDGPEQKLPPGIEFARYMICRAAGLKLGVSALDLAKHYYPGFSRIQTLLKEVVPAASTQDSTWAAPLIPTSPISDFAEWLRPQTIIGRIESFTRMSFYGRYGSETSGGSGYWVGEGKAKPLTKFDYASGTIPHTKVANIAVLTDELIRFSDPSAETRVRNALARANLERLDTDFIDPAKTAVAGVSPASITNGITNLNSAGVTLDSVDVDVQAMMSAFINAKLMPTHWIMPNTVALALSMMRTSLGNYAFPTINMNGGTFYGLPVITSQYAILGTPANNLIVLIAAPEIYLADDGGFSIDLSREASLEMDDAPTMDAGSLGSPAGATGSTVVSMFQTNSTAVRCERSIYWARRRNAGVVWMDDVQWAAGTQ